MCSATEDGCHCLESEGNYMFKNSSQRMYSEGTGNELRNKMAQFCSKFQNW